LRNVRKTIASSPDESNPNVLGSGTLIVVVPGDPGPGAIGVTGVGVVVLLAPVQVPEMVLVSIVTAAVFAKALPQPMVALVSSVMLVSA
jgi:hypothetical protein